MELMNELKRRIPSKRDAYTYWTDVCKSTPFPLTFLHSGRKVLPPYELTDVNYFKELIQGSKLALNQQDTNNIKVTKFNELSTATALEQIQHDEELARYVPSHWFKDKARRSRDFLWLVLSSLRPDYVQTVLDYAH